jgi:hypothetical protein
MNLIRTIAQVIAAALWFLFGGALGATIGYISVLSVLWYLTGLAWDGLLTAADGMLAGALGGMSVFFAAPLSFIAGLLGALYLRERWQLFQDKRQP